MEITDKVRYYCLQTCHIFSGSTIIPIEPYTNNIYDVDGIIYSDTTIDWYVWDNRYPSEQYTNFYDFFSDMPTLRENIIDSVLY